MKRLLFTVCLILLFCVTLIYGNPKIAILDAVIENGVSPQVIVPVTEKIIEEFVRSGNYIVLERSNIADVLKEKEFQLSGLVADSEIKEAGEYLGADLVGVARVSKVGLTYFISAKVIDVKTGQIKSSASGERRGEIDVVLAVAREVGQKLNSDVSIAQTTEKVDSRPEQKLVKPKTVQPETEKPQNVQPQPEPSSEENDSIITFPKSHLNVSWISPGYLGGGNDAILAVHDSYPAYNVWTNGFDSHLLLSLAKFFYGFASFSMGFQSFEYTDTEEQYEDFSTIDARFGGGGIISFGDLLQVYAGIGGAYMNLTMGDLWTELEGESESGFGFSAEVGIDLILLEFLTVGAKYHFLTVTLPGDAIFTSEQDFGYSGFSIGAGLAF